MKGTLGKRAICIISGNGTIKGNKTRNVTGYNILSTQKFLNRQRNYSTTKRTKYKGFYVELNKWMLTY